MRTVSLLLALLTASVGLNAQPLSVAITQTPTNLHAFYLDVLNMTPGVTYGVGGKVMLDNDPFNTWTLLDVFDAPAPAIRYEVAATFPQRTYAAMNLNNWTGPSVRILSPAPGSIVSGDVPVQVLVADVIPLEKVEVFVGEVGAGFILAGQGGVMNLPSYWFPNGEHEIWVRAVDQGFLVDTDGDNVPDSPATFDGWGSVTVMFSNEVYMVDYSPLYSGVGFIQMDYFATTPHDWTFEVFRETDGELLHTQSGTTIDGNINPQWNFTDLNGNNVAPDEYVFSLTATPVGAAPSPPPPPPPSPSTNAPPPPPPAPGGSGSFAAVSSDGSSTPASGSELTLIESGTVLSPIEAPPQVKLSGDTLAEHLAKLTLTAGEPPPLPPSVPKLSFTASTSGPMSATLAGSKNIKTTNIFDAGVTVAKYVISYGEWPIPELNDQLAGMNFSVSYRANTAAFFDPDIIGENRQAHGTIRADFSSEPYAIHQPTRTNDMAALTNALADTLTGSWLWDGHSSSTSLLAWDQFWTAYQLADLLGNTYKMSGPYMKPKIYTRRYFSTFITGCSAANGYWSVVVGTPPQVKQNANTKIKKTAYIGFKTVSKTGPTKMSWIKAIHVVWIDWNIYDTPLEAAVDAANTQYPAVEDWKPAITGFRPLAYDGVDSR